MATQRVGSVGASVFSSGTEINVTGSVGMLPGHVARLKERAAERIIKKHIEDAVKQSQDVAQARVRELAEPHRKSGKFSRSIKKSPVAHLGGRVWEGTIYSTSPYALFLEEGTGEFGPSGRRIYPQNSKTFAFKVAVPKTRPNRKFKPIPRGGATVYPKYIRGMEALHFFENAAQSTRREIILLHRLALREAAEEARLLLRSGT